MTVQEHALQEIDNLFNTLLMSKALKAEDREAIREYLLVWAERFQ